MGNTALGCQERPFFFIPSSFLSFSHVKVLVWGLLSVSLHLSEFFHPLNKTLSKTRRYTQLFNKFQTEFCGETRNQNVSFQKD